MNTANPKPMNITFQQLIDSAPNTVKVKLFSNQSLRERPDFHPEESAFEHIRIVTERLIPTGDMNLIFAGILHDICKADTAKINEKTGWPTCPGHDAKAFDFIKEFQTVQTWITCNGGDVDKVANICLNHMRFHQLGDMREHKRETNIQKWKDQGIWESLQIFGAADNMLEEFDPENLSKSFKFNKPTI